MSATTKSKQIDKKVSRIELLKINLRKETLDYANVYCKANSANVAKFLRELIENVPYKVRSIQVDGS
ncbi:MAG: hypothetical protein II453_13275 [Alphaproteobacteria bacterium]|nr:hypothetical protein [Alphaproteobacteria bacterium]MBQ3944588.1 hypothetical protein [Alphaproteobacteria bacterium]